MSGTDDAIDWASVIPWIKSNTKLELWVKGCTFSCPSCVIPIKEADELIKVYTADDVILAIRYGLDGVILSNHGGRQLDTVPATLDALRECAPAAAGKIKIGIDSGIRRGSDIFKALALGAQFCFVGRIPIWGLAVCFAFDRCCSRFSDGQICTLLVFSSGRSILLTNMFHAV